VDNKDSTPLSGWTRGDEAGHAQGVAERKSSDERRDEILRATIRIVARKGFASVTLRDVAAEIGIVHGLIRHYFSSREELVAEAFDYAVAAELAADREALAGLDPLEQLAGWFVSTPQEHYLVWIDAWSEAPRNPALAAALARHHADCEALLAGIIGRAVSAGLAQSNDPAADARTLTALADGVAVQQHAMGILDAAVADEIVFSAAESRLALLPGALAAVTPVPARGLWSGAR